MKPLLNITQIYYWVCTVRKVTHLNLVKNYDRRKKKDPWKPASDRYFILDIITSRILSTLQINAVILTG